MRRGKHDRRRLRERLGGQGGIRLTSMMDILTTLLLFLLKSFVADGETHVPPPGIELPKSIAVAAPEASLVIAIGEGAILVNAEKVASIDAAMANPGLLIEPLDARLGAVRAQLAGIERAGGAVSQRIVTIQGDREIEFEVLEKVMYTVHQNGFEHVALAVLKSA
jgi:biopolymer transport protein ExbD